MFKASAMSNLDMWNITVGECSSFVKYMISLDYAALIWLGTVKIYIYIYCLEHPPGCLY